MTWLDDLRERWPDWRRRLWHRIGGVSVRTKILGIVLAVTLVPGLIITYQVRSTLVHTYRTQLRQEGIAVARDVAARSTDLVLINDLYALNRLLRDTRRYNTNVRYIFILDEKGQIIAHTFGDGFPLELLNVNVLPPDTPYQVTPLWSEEGVIWDVAAPIFDGRAGVARVGLSEQSMWRSINAITGQIVLSMTLISLLGIGAAFVLTWLLTRPLMELVDVTERVAKGDYSPRVRRWADDEVGILQDAFNRMVEQLARAEKERAERERLRQEYLERVIRAQEDERKRIARELHDEMGQALASVLVGLHNVETAPTPEEQEQRMQDLRRVVTNALERVRHLAFDLRPKLLDDLGLVPAIKRYAAKYQERFGIETSVHALALDGTRLSPELEITVYRVVQEALTNAAKYAHCEHVSIVLQMRRQELSVIIEDDGEGFDAENLLREGKGSTHLGLYGMKERAELVGGTLEIESKKGVGTTVYLRVPLKVSIEIQAPA